ncbi:aminoacyl--tRNA ligase-related protein [Streptomyces sp. NPDC093109]|uniref:aminoacyl--tRNA ligase-related protein n=1 Tax=Streptomyces sp. NPDC093109 TaxID=3154977 RepID=UPI00344E6846
MPDPGNGTTGRAAWSVSDGLATLDEPAVLLSRSLDAVFTGWGLAGGAVRRSYPPLLDVGALRSLDYFRNFPHLGGAVTRLREDRLGHHAQAGGAGPLPAADLADAALLLPSAACYACFLDLSGVRLTEPLTITTAATCFRNEDHYDGLRRLRGFTMREIVCVGSTEDVHAHVERYHGLIAGFGAALGLSLDRAPATDPFFEKDGARSLMQRLSPVKEEYLHRDGTALASANHHRNFFGERRGLTYRGSPAFTGCVAFGLERWLHALDDRFEGDLRAADRAVRQAADEAVRRAEAPG